MCLRYIFMVFATLMMGFTLTAADNFTDRAFLEGIRREVRELCEQKDDVTKYRELLSILNSEIWKTYLASDFFQMAQERIRLFTDQKTRPLYCLRLLEG